MPDKDGQEVLFFVQEWQPTANRGIFSGYFNKALMGFMGNVNGGVDGFFKKKVTHWMPAPEPPQTEKEAEDA